MQVLRKYDDRIDAKAPSRTRLTECVAQQIDVANQKIGSPIGQRQCEEVTTPC